MQPHNANNSPVTGLTRPAFAAPLTFSFAQSVPKHSVVLERLPCFTREKMSRAINIPIFTPHPVCGWRCLSCQLGRWGECLQQQQGGEGRVGGECRHVIVDHTATQSLPNPISGNTAKCTKCGSGLQSNVVLQL